MGTASQWLATERDSTTSRGATNTRTIVMSGTDTTVLASPTKTKTSTEAAVAIAQVVDSPTKTRTSTENAIAVATVTSEDEGYVISFSVIIEGGLGTIPAGDTGPGSICP